MTCDQCGAANQAHTGFCPSCGATMQPSPTGDWSSAPNSQEVPPAVAPMAPAQTLVPVYGRHGALPWIVLLVACVTAGTVVQLSRRGPASMSAQIQNTPTAAAVAPVAATEPAPTAVQNTLARLLKITDVTEFVGQPEVAEALKQVLGGELEEFQRNLSVAGSPILAGDTITFTACAPQACGAAESAVSVATDTGTLVAAIFANNHIRIYGTKSNRLEDCPAALQAWATKLQSGPGSSPGVTRSADAETGKQEETSKTADPDAVRERFAASPDGQRLYSAFYAAQMRMFNKNHPHQSPAEREGGEKRGAAQARCLVQRMLPEDPEHMTASQQSAFEMIIRDLPAGGQIEDPAVRQLYGAAYFSCAQD